MKAIFNHFNSLGGLYVSQENLLDTRIFNDEIKLIEEYLKRDIPKLLWNILKKSRCLVISYIQNYVTNM